MARAPNFTYQNPAGEITNSLVRAIFGDPAMAAKQREMQAQAQLRDAQTREAEAHGRLYAGQADGRGAQNAALAGLPALIASLQPQQQPATFDQAFDPAAMAAAQGMDQGGAAPEALPVGETRDQAFQRGIGPLIASLAQAQGDKVDTSETVGSLASFLGGDELARRGMVAQGHSPSADFAITPDRADQIAATDAGAKQASAWGVARINHGNDIPVANIRAGASRDVATINNRDDVPVARIAAAGRETVAGIKASGTAPGFDAIQRVFPNAKMNSGWRSVEHNREVGGVPGSDHLGNKPGVQGYDLDPQPGMTVLEGAARIEEANPGVKVIDARSHRAKRPDGSLGGMHWHYSLANVGGGAKASAADKASAWPKAAAAPKVQMISPAQATALETRLTTFLTDNDWNVTPELKQRLLEKAVTNYAASGNPLTAVREATSRLETPSRPLHPQGARPAPQQGAVRISTEAAYNQLPAGATYRGPDGHVRKKQPTVSNW